MGAAGRDFHNFNVYFRDNNQYEVVAFTATQIPNIADRIYPPELAGKLYPRGIPIFPEGQISNLIKEFDVNLVVFAYSDIPYSYVMNRAAIVNTAGSDFVMMGPKTTMLKSTKLVIAVCAVRTGSGKSQISRKIFEILYKRGLKVAAIRHPMPYNTDLTTQISQRFAKYEDLDRHHCTIEEREEYEPYIKLGGVVFAGVDYEQILRNAETEADIIIWDGGNNDFPFIKPDLLITIADPHRPGHENSYYPGEINIRAADIVVINKVNTAKKNDVQTVRDNIKKMNQSAILIDGVSVVITEQKQMIHDKRVLVIEDGPTVTHGNMKYGAAMVAALENKAKKIVDPRLSAVGSIVKIFKKFSHLTQVLPAMGYSKKQIQELEETINNANCDVVVSGTPIDLSRVLHVKKPIVRVGYGVGQKTAEDLEKIITKFIPNMKDLTG